MFQFLRYCKNGLGYFLERFGFQFQFSGTVKTMVIIFPCCEPAFQFLIGTVKTNRGFNIPSDAVVFQFLIGTVKTKHLPLFKELQTTFQFLIGTVKTKVKYVMSVITSTCFNSS